MCTLATGTAAAHTFAGQSGSSKHQRPNAPSNGQAASKTRAHTPLAVTTNTHARMSVAPTPYTASLQSKNKALELENRRLKQKQQHEQHQPPLRHRKQAHDGSGLRPRQPQKRWYCITQLQYGNLSLPRSQRARPTPRNIMQCSFTQPEPAILLSLRPTVD